MIAIRTGSKLVTGDKLHYVLRTQCSLSPEYRQERASEKPTSMLFLEVACEQHACKMDVNARFATDYNRYFILEPRLGSDLHYVLRT